MVTDLLVIVMYGSLSCLMYLYWLSSGLQWFND